MKTFEEKFSAWIDGQLTGDELADFERELATRPDADAEKFAAHQLGDLLREHVATPRLANADFFNHQLMQRIAADEAQPAPAPRRAFFWTLPRMALAGAFCLLLSFAMYFVAVPKTQRQIEARQEYVAKILNAHSDDPAISATAFHDKQQNVTVLWLDGLDYIPDHQQVR